jgi:hypothetical protein
MFQVIIYFLTHIIFGLLERFYIFSVVVDDFLRINWCGGENNS